MELGKEKREGEKNKWHWCILCCQLHNATLHLLWILLSRVTASLPLTLRLGSNGSDPLSQHFQSSLWSVVDQRSAANVLSSLWLTSLCYQRNWAQAVCERGCVCVWERHPWLNLHAWFFQNSFKLWFFFRRLSFLTPVRAWTSAGKFRVFWKANWIWLILFTVLKRYNSWDCIVQNESKPCNTGCTEAKPQVSEGSS